MPTCYDKDFEFFKVCSDGLNNVWSSMFKCSMAKIGVRVRLPRHEHVQCCSKYRLLQVFLEFSATFRLKDFQSCSWWYYILVFVSKKGQNRLSKFESHSQQILQSKLHWFWNELYSIKRIRTSQFQHDLFQRFFTVLFLQGLVIQVA